MQDPAKATDAATLFQQGYGPYQPKCQYPIDSRGRHFSSKWYVEFKWLEYSPHLDKAYCFPCRVFNRNSQQEQVFVSIGFQNWRKAVEVSCTSTFYYSQNSISDMENRSEKAEQS